MRPRLRLTFAVMAALLASAVNCGREITAPDSGNEATGPLARGLSFRTVFPEALSRSTGPDIVPFTSVRVIVRHSDNTIALDTLIAFPPTADSVAVSLNVRLLPNVPPTGERLTISLQYINTANVTVFSGTAPVDVMPTLLGQDPPPPVIIPVSYSGPGASATKIVISPKSQTVSAGGAFQFTAQAFDAANNVLPGTPVVFSSSNTALAVLPSAASGSGSTLVGRGTAQITATLLTGPSDVAVLTVQPALSAIASVSGSGQSAPAGTLLPTPVVVRVTATDGLAVSGVPVTFVAANGGSVTSSSVVTDANGNAQTSWTLGPVAGAQTLTATASGIATAATFTATATAVVPTALVVTQQPTTTAAGQLIGNVVITVQGANGITATSFTGAVSIALGANPAGATLGGTTTVNAVAGIATFAGLTLNKAGAGFTLVASSGSLTSATTSPFDITTAPASVITLVSGGGQTGAAGATLTQPVVVSVTDAFGNPIVGQTVTFAVASGGGSVATPSAATNALGQASTTWTLGALAGSQTITASSGALAPLTISATATAVGGTVTALLFSSAPSVVTAGVANSFVVQARDAQGRLVTSFTGNVTLAFGTNPSGGTLTGLPTVAAVGGVATFNVSVDKSGTGYTFIASTGTVSSTPFTFSVRPAAATSLAFATQPSSLAAGARITPAVVVTARDPFGNTDTTFTGTIDIAIAANPGDDILGGTTSVSAVAGVASFSTLTMNIPAVGYTLMATSSGLSSATSTAFDVTPGVAPTALVFSAVPTTVTAGATFTPVVQARNAQGAVLTSFNGNITLALGANPAGGTLAGTTTVAAVSGIASFPGVSIGKAGTGYGLVATFGNVTSAPSPLTVVPAPAVDLAFTSQPSNTSAGSPITPSVVVTARDAFGNNATSFTGNVSVLLGSNPGNATLIGTTTVAAVAGVATFTNLSVTTAATGYVLIAQATGLRTTTSAFFDIVAGTAMTWTNVNGGLWSVASNWSLGRIPQASDSVAITLSGTYTVTQDVPFIGGAALTVGATSGTQTLAVSAQPLTITGNMIVGSNGVVTPVNATFAVGATLFNQGTLNPRNTTLNASVANQGTIVWDGTGSILGTFTTTVGSTLRLEAGSSTGVANLTISNGFTNNGTIDMTTVVSSYTDILTVTNGTLTNAVGATILSTVGTGGTRTINATLDNKGTLTFNQPLVLNKASAAHTNSGTINVVAADWTLNQAGGSFTNTGTVTIGTGRTWTVNGGTLNLTGGAVNGAGTLALFGTTANFATGFSNSVTALVLNGSILNGPGTITNAPGQTQSMVNTTVNAPLVNQGLLVFDGTGGFTNTFTAATGSILRLQASGSTGVSNLTITNGFTNSGTIDLTTIVSSYTDILTVSNGTLTNAPGATITSSVGTAGTRTINAVIDNQGTITYLHPLALNKPSAAHTNSGTINVIAADWTLNQSGTGASFTNTGTVTIGTGRTWTVNGGTLNLTSGAVSGAGTLALFGTTANFATGFNNSVTSLALNGSIINGPGTITNTSGQTQSMVNTTVNAPLVNQGLLVFDGTGSFTNTFTAATGSTLRLQASGSTGVSNLTITNGFTNNGTIDMTTVVSSYTDILTVTNGTLTNAAGATILSSVGTGGTRTINAMLDNQGTVTFNQPLALTKASATHTNSGTISLAGADWTLTQSGTGASFTNTGTVAIGTGRTWTVNGGTLNLASGTVSGAGTLALFGTTANFAAGFNNSVTALALNGSVLNGPGTVTNTAGQTQSMINTTVNAPLVNQGVLVFDGTGSFTNSFTAAAGSTLRLQASGSTGVSNLTITNGFTNNGTIDLTTVISSYTDILTVGGTLTNAPGATINSSIGLGGSRTINATLDNQGALTFDQPLTLTKASAAHTNSGTITLRNADWTLTQSGTGASFTNTGTVAIGTGRTWTVNGGTLNLASGAVSGAGTLALFGTDANFATGFSNSVTALSLNGSTLNGPGTVTNASGQTMSMTNTTVNAPLVNQGLLVYDGTGTFFGPFTTVTGSTLRLQGGGSTGTSNLTITNGFTNNGIIDLTTVVSSYTDLLTVTIGKLTNAPGATISSSIGNGGSRTINAVLDNQGTIAISQPLSLSRTSAAHTNSGAINVSGGDFTLAQSGTAPSFTNTSAGTVTIGAGRTWVVSNGTLALNGTVSGAGSLSLTGVTANFASGFSNGVTALSVSNSTLNGPGTITNAAGQTQSMVNTTINAPLVNQGVLIFDGTGSFTNTFTASANSTLRLQASGATGTSNLTIANGFTNFGAIELTTIISSYTDILTVTSGSLTNAPGATLSSLAGTGGTRTINATVNNQGALAVATGGTGLLTIVGGLTNTGSIALKLGGTTAITQYDRLAVTGTATLAGTLDVTLVNNFVPSSNNTFSVLTTTAPMSGRFGTTNLPPTINNPPTYNSTSVVLVSP